MFSHQDLCRYRIPQVRYLRGRSRPDSSLRMTLRLFFVSLFPSRTGGSSLFGNISNRSIAGVTSQIVFVVFGLSTMIRDRAFGNKVLLSL